MSALDSKIAVVTGAGAGIGRAAALELAVQGATVIAVDRRAEAASAVQAAIDADGGAAVALAADVGTVAGATSIAQAAERLGGIDILVNNAGIQRYGTVETTTEAEWDEVMAVNLKSVYLVSHACLPLMRGRGGAAIVNVASVQALGSQASVAAYATSKHGVLGLTRSMAVDLAPEIRVNCVCPGSVDTPMLRFAQSEAPDPDAFWRTVEGMHPLGRVARPEEVGSVIAFLAGPGASFMTGAAVPVDGGLLVPFPGSPLEER
jgi:NAD(P)-dependent dehydrogenase (short-subunit alcohol dehydrogenase family)